MNRHSIASIVLVAGILSGCDERKVSPFVGTWENASEQVTIRDRGFGSGRVLFISHERPLTWKLADADHMVLEFGETAALRTEMDARLLEDGTLLVSFLKSKTVLTKVAPQNAQTDR